MSLRCALPLLILAVAAARADELPPLAPIDREIDIAAYAGDWYVLGSIPIDIPFFSDAEAYNYVERYEILRDGVVGLTCAFNDGGFDGKRREFAFKGFVEDGTGNASWKVQFVWPIRMRYLVIYLSDDYRTTIVGVPSRRWVWIMARDPDIADADYARLLDFLDGVGYETGKIRRIPHARLVAQGETSHDDYDRAATGASEPPTTSAPAAAR